MKLKEFHKQFQETLSSLYEKGEVNTFFFMLTEAFLGINRLQLALRPDLELTATDLAKMQQALEELKVERPIQYIIGKTEFYELEFLVNEDTLIPRPETEELVDWIVQDVKASENQSQRILDIGTGSGCIAISIANKLSKAEVSAIDLSEGALKVAHENAQLNSVTVNFVQQDILNVEESNALFQNESLHVVVSNPPYVRNTEKRDMRNNVLQYEPKTALFVTDEDPLIFYVRIADFASEKLIQGGVLYFEINQYLAEETQKMVESKGFYNVEIRKDLRGNFRMLKAIKL
ncbi:release factor glutamine methyltransferase [Pustulibacterium marinum]|uniref:peptide chain release factor N(5)-glutamine methyltransferase n=1 Tax=Pustulibacterium marinum TaxID=1224947 RepID=A0A1I7IK49_9FLAO|nr:peptide chain release factor N(5)-glutamine methyltransferase [Pustulibacterium marinum]SFU73321.1 release factor glutamine methyltransferase [Pustulibacterium marinum]